MIPPIPNELLYNFVEQTTDASSLSTLARTNRTFNEIVRRHGWRSFVRHHFASKAVNLTPKIDYGEAARGLIGFEKAWRRREMGMAPIWKGGRFFFANGLKSFRDPDIPSHMSPSVSVPRGRQTIAHRPVIDSIEEIRASHWSSRQEFLVFSTGVGLCLRSKIYERYPGEDWSGIGDRNLRACYHRLGPPHLRDGPDDIVSLNILDASNDDASGLAMRMLVGRASGGLSLVQLKMNDRQRVRELQTASFRFNGGQSKVCLSASKDRFATVDKDGKIQIFLTLGNETAETNGIQAVSENENCSENSSSNGRELVEPSISEKVDEYLRSGHFLSENILLIGKHKSSHPIGLYTIRPTGLTSGPTPSFVFDSDPLVSTTTFCRIPTNPGPHTDVFLSGNSDGTTRLHDIRSRRAFEALLGDPLDDGTPWSISTKGINQVFVALGDRGVVQSFDLRASLSKSSSLPKSFKKRCETGGLKGMQEQEYRAATRPANGWSLFVDQAKSVHHLSSPSEFSPTMYVASEGRVDQWEFVDHRERFVDSIYHVSEERGGGVNGWRWLREGQRRSRGFPVSRFEHATPNLISG